MFVNISNVMNASLSNQRMRGTIQPRMIGWELIHCNSFICIFLRKLNGFQLTQVRSMLHLQVQDSAFAGH